MADVLVASEIQGDAAPWLQALKIAEAALNQFASTANATRIAPIIDLDMPKMQSQWQQVLSDMNSKAQAAAQQLSNTLSSTPVNLNVGLNLTGAQAQLQAWLNTVQNMPITLTVPNAQQIGQQIGQAMAAAFNAGVTLPAGGGGGGRGGGYHRMGGFGRVLMPLFAMHQLVREVEIGQEQDQHLMDARGDPAKVLEADIRRKHEEDSLLMGGGRLMRAIRENTIGPMFGEQTVEQQEADVRALKDSAERRKETVENRRFSIRISDEYGIATAPDDRRRASEKSRAELAAKQQAITDHHNEQRDAINARHNAATTAATIEAEKWESSALKKKLTGELSHTEQGAQMQQRADKIQQLEMEELNRSTIKAQRETVASHTADESRRIKEENFADSQAKLRADMESARAGGDKRAFERLSLQREQEGAEFKATREGGVMPAEAKREAAYQSEKLRKTQIYEEIEATQKLADIQQRISGPGHEREVGKEAAAEEEYVRKLDEEIKAKTAIGMLDKDIAAQAKLLRENRDKMVADRKAEGLRQESVAASGSARKVSDIYAEADEAMMGASGDTRGQSRARLQRNIQDRIADLTGQRTLVGENSPEGKHLTDQIVAEAMTAKKREDALGISNARQDARRLSDIQGQTEETSLRTQGRGYEASKASINRHFDQQVKEAEESKAPAEIIQALQQQRGASLAHVEWEHTKSIQDIKEQSMEQQLRNRGQDGAADLAAMKYRNEKELAEAANDPQKEDAILVKQIAGYEADIKGKTLRPTSLRSAYDELMGAVADRGRAAEIKKIKEQEAAAKRKQWDIRNGVDPVTGKPFQNGAPKTPAADAAMAAMEASKALTDAAKKIGDAAQKIVDAPPIFLIGWN